MSKTTEQIENTRIRILETIRAHHIEGLEKHSNSVIPWHKVMEGDKGFDRLLWIKACRIHGDVQANEKLTNEDEVFDLVDYLIEWLAERKAGTINKETGELA